jgi:hypothetical protein
LTGLTSNTIDGVKILIKDVLCPKYEENENWIWMGWRQEELWTLEMDDLFKANKVALTKLWKYFFVVKKTKIMSLEDAV